MTPSEFELTELASASIDNELDDAQLARTSTFPHFEIEVERLREARRPIQNLASAHHVEQVDIELMVSQGLREFDRANSASRHRSGLGLKLVAAAAGLVVAVGTVRQFRTSDSKTAVGAPAVTTSIESTIAGNQARVANPDAASVGNASNDQIATTAQGLTSEAGAMSTTTAMSSTVLKASSGQSPLVIELGSFQSLDAFRTAAVDAAGGGISSNNFDSTTALATTTNTFPPQETSQPCADMNTSAGQFEARGLVGGRVVIAVIDTAVKPPFVTLFDAATCNQIG